MKNWILSHGLKLATVAFVTGATCSIVMAVDTDKDEKRAKWIEQRRLSKITKTIEAVEGFQPVEMFEGMQSGNVDVTIKAKDAADSTLIVTNKTDKPLAIQMPATFSAVPVLRQFGGGGGGRGGGGGGGVFNIPAGKSGKLQIKTVCLEHGKPDPRSAIEYRVQPLENLTEDAKVAETIRMLANDEITQNVAQATTWHLTDDLSFESMVTMNRVERMGGYYERFFSVDELKLAAKVLAEAGRRAELRSDMKDDKGSTPSASTEMVTSEAVE